LQLFGNWLAWGWLWGESSPNLRAWGRGRRHRAAREVRSRSCPSGALRVRVHAGIDPVTKKRHRLEEIVPAGPKAAARAEKVRTTLLAEVACTTSPELPSATRQRLERQAAFPCYQDELAGLPVLPSLQTGLCETKYGDL
jgi:hypothetical protein